MSRVDEGPMLLAATRLLQRPLARSLATSSACLQQAPPKPLPYIPRKRRTPKVNPKTESLLPPHKLRALVSLYHQCDDFITEEDLLDHIDAAFLDDDGKRRLSINHFEFKRFEEVLKNQREAPRISPWSHDSTSPGPRDQRFSGRLSGRESQIVDALYGVESGSLPGYETLVEAKKRKE